MFLVGLALGFEMRAQPVVGLLRLLLCRLRRGRGGLAQFPCAPLLNEGFKRFVELLSPLGLQDACFLSRCFFGRGNLLEGAGEAVPVRLLFLLEREASFGCFGANLVRQVGVLGSRLRVRRLGCGHLLVNCPFVQSQTGQVLDLGFPVRRALVLEVTCLGCLFIVVTFRSAGRRPCMRSCLRQSGTLQRQSFHGLRPGCDHDLDSLGKLCPLCRASSADCCHVCTARPKPRLCRTVFLQIAFQLRNPWSELKRISAGVTIL